jgi:hypothetical protein
MNLTLNEFIAGWIGWGTFEWKVDMIDVVQFEAGSIEISLNDEKNCLIGVVKREAGWIYWDKS